MESIMKLKFALAGVLFVGLAGSALAVGANENFYVFHDMSAKKCSVVKEKPITGTVGSGQVYQSEADAQAAMEKMPECKS
jgi:hypothetical protein